MIFFFIELIIFFVWVVISIVVLFLLILFSVFIILIVVLGLRFFVGLFVIRILGLLIIVLVMDIFCCFLLDNWFGNDLNLLDNLINDKVIGIFFFIFLVLVLIIFNVKDIFL